MTSVNYVDAVLGEIKTNQNIGPATVVNLAQKTLVIYSFYNKQVLGSGCGSVGRAVAFDSRGPRFESSHRKKIMIMTTVLKRQK